AHGIHSHENFGRNWIQRRSISNLIFKGVDSNEVRIGYVSHAIVGELIVQRRGIHYDLHPDDVCGGLVELSVRRGGGDDVTDGVEVSLGVGGGKVDEGRALRLGIEIAVNHRTGGG